MKVQETKNYSIFSYIEGNRNINELNRNRIIESFKKNYLICPILVNDKMEIIDGQHRFEAARELNLPIYYFIVSNYGLKEVQILNANQKNWNTDDYVEGFINLGKSSYRVYKNFRSEYGLPSIQTIEILEGRRDSGADVSRNMRLNFIEGDFKIKNLKESRRIATGIVMFKDIYEGYKRKAFVAAMITLLKKEVFDVDILYKKLAQRPTALVHCVSASSYTELIEQIYNHRNREKVNLRF